MKEQSTDMDIQTAARRSALAAGILYLLTFAGSIAAGLLVAPVLDDPAAAAAPTADTQLALAAVFELVNVLALIGTAVAVFSIVKREHEGLALGFVATRLFEGAVIAIGVIALMALVTVRQAAAAGTPELYAPVDQALAAIRQWSILIGPGMAAFNALMFGTVLYRARLVPRAIPALGIAGSPLLIAYVVGTMLGVTGPRTAFEVIAVFPFFTWELIIGLWMTFKGFDRRAPILAGSAPAPVSTSATVTTAAGVA